MVKLGMAQDQITVGSAVGGPGRRPFQIFKHIDEIIYAAVQFKPLDAARHSTVTDLARLRGWSTSVPFSMAVW